MATGVILADVDWRAAGIAANDADLGGEFGDFCRTELADKALFDHELGEGREAAVFLQAAMVVEASAVLGDIQSVQQFFLAARTTQWLGQRLARVVAMLMQQFEEFENATRCDLDALKIVEPDALT